MTVSFSEFQQQAAQAGIKENGSFSAKKQRDFLRQFFPDAATGEIEKTYLYACETRQIEPEISDENLLRFSHLI